MREIKFRCWHEGYKGTAPPVMLFDEKPGDCLYFLKQGQPVHVMQYTGLKDKNGKEIYESDIVRVIGPWEDPDGSNVANVVIQFHTAGGYTVEWSNGFLGGEADITLIGWAIGEGYTLEVIGNIYANPELLK